MEKLKMQTKNKVDVNIDTIGSLFPNVLTEKIIGYDKNNEPIVRKAIDFDMLKQELSMEIVEGKEERYQMNWPGKKEAILRANAPINKTLRPCREESVNFDTTENLYIEGDNLEVLKLLQETYLNKVKMIYIDPPYNTGNDSFVYDDGFAMSAEEFSKLSNQYDEEGNIKFDIRKNNESNGRIHTDWLNMMYPRLKLAKDLLTEDGVIFISIDDNEENNLKKLCNEIFGESNYIGTLPRVTKKAGKSSESISKNHDYIVIYSKSENYIVYPFEHNDEGFKFSDEYMEERGMYKLNQTLDYNTLGYVSSLDYPIEVDGDIYYAGSITSDEYEKRKLNNPKDDFRWRWSKELFEFGYNNGFIVIKKYENNKSRIYTKTYQNASIDKDGTGKYFIKYQSRTKALSTLEFIENEYSNDNSKKNLVKIFGKNVFEYSKPVKLIETLIRFTTKENDIVLDFFSGSATTAQAVLTANDSKRRKFIMIQLPEKTDPKSEAFKDGYSDICKIGKERIKKVGEKIIEKRIDSSKYSDVGFRVLKLDSSNMKDVYYKPNEYTQNMLDMLDDNIKEDRNAEDLLFQVMLELGELLSSDIKELDIKGKKVFNVGAGNIVACFDKEVSEEVITEIAKMTPFYAVFRDSSLGGDSVAANFEQIFKTYSPNTIRKVL